MRDAHPSEELEHVLRLESSAKKVSDFANELEKLDGLPLPDLITVNG